MVILLLKQYFIINIQVIQLIDHKLLLLILNIINGYYNYSKEMVKLDLLFVDIVVFLIHHHAYGNKIPPEYLIVQFK